MAATEAAMPNNIDPLAYEERLTTAGVPAEQAHVHAEAMGQVKSELDALDEKIKSSDNTSQIKDGLTELNTKVDRTKAELEGKIDGTKAELEAKIDSTKAEIEGKIDRTKTELEGKIDRTKTELEGKIDRTKAELEGKIDSSIAELEAKLVEKIHRAKVETICWTVGIVVSVCTLQGYIIVNMLK
jgi:F0F1-type ATP synthase membrane subunit b/b'